MGFDRRENAKVCTPEDGDTLQSIAERESEAGNPLTWHDLALFNWGTDDPETVNEFFRDELGAHRRDADNNFVLSSDDEARTDLLIPTRFQRTGLPLQREHVLRVRKKVAPPQFLECCSIPGATFAFDKSFIRPSVVDHIQPLEEAIDRHPEAKVMIFGHTDKVGSEAYNKSLSERRAESAFAFITDNADVWESLFNEENWGTEAIQEVLKDFDDPSFDPGPVDGIYGPKTREAVRNYQEARGLAVDGVAGPLTRKRMFFEYMTSKHDVELTADQFMDPKHMGCGEFNPVKDTEEPHEPNRRVTFFLFHPDRLPNLPCKHGDLNPCHKQLEPALPRHVESFHCSFFDSLAKKCACEQPVGVVESHLSYLMRTNSSCFPLAEKPFKVHLPDATVEGATDENGLLSVAKVPPGDFDVEIGGTTTVLPSLPKKRSKVIHTVNGHFIQFD